MNKKEITKQKIIGIVNDAISNKIDKSVFADDDKYGIGCNQFRELSALCLRAECYEEIELQIKYNKAKISDDKSWNKKPQNGKALADVVIECMEQIKKYYKNQLQESNEQQKKEIEAIILKNLSLMFGYFYWNARICAAENKENYINKKQNDSNNHSQQNSGSYQKNYNGYNKSNNNRNGNYKNGNNGWKRG